MRKIHRTRVGGRWYPLVAIKSSRSSAESAATPLSQMVITQLVTDEFCGIPQEE